MFNELIFFSHIIVISVGNIIALRFGKEALVAFLCIQALIANIFVSKQILLFGLCVTGTDAFIIGCDLSLNLLQEYFGRKVANKTIWISFSVLLFYLVMTQIQLFYIPNCYDTMHPHFQMILGMAPRIILASLVAYLTAIKVEYILYQWLKSKLNGRFLILRNYGAIIVSQLLDTIIFSILGLWGSVHSIIHIMILSYIIKLIALFIATPLVFTGSKYFINHR
ncbi:queuosine precursor transporter [bacterium]|jgi:queuosine precursor transporter|nr:queuosine precursor transporter [bacterium]MBT5014907.1 queuosine precursor transporter [bacterium]